MRDLTMNEIGMVDGGGDALAVIAGAASVLGVVSTVAGVAAAIPGPHSPKAAAVALGTGLAATGLLAASTAIGAVTQ